MSKNSIMAHPIYEIYIRNKYKKHKMCLNAKKRTLENVNKCDSHKNCEFKKNSAIN